LHRRIAFKSTELKATRSYKEFDVNSRVKMVNNVKYELPIPWHSCGIF
jgi:hypothetical protein